MGEGALGGFTVSWHVWAGSAILALVVVRLIVRLVQGKPDHGAVKSGMDRLADAAHWLLYGLMALVPALGALAWFAGIESAGDAHVLAMNAMMVVILGHAGMALLHHYVLKDGLLGRMIPALA